MSGFVLVMVIGQVELQPRMGDPISGLDAAYTARFEAGAQLYNTSLIAEDGLGPIFKQYRRNDGTPLGKSTQVLLIQNISQPKSN